jgi:signal transduction histidine kinase
MTGGAVTPLSALRLAFPLYALAMLLPFLIRSFWIGGNAYIAGGLILTTYMAVLFGYSRTTHHTLRSTFDLRIEKDHLLHQLERLDRSRALFLAGVSHDLKQPVQALGMFTACLESLAREQAGKLGDELGQLARNSQLALASINGQVSRLLELARLESGEVETRRRRIQLSDIYAYTRAQQTARADAKGLRLHFVPTTLAVMSDLKMLQSICDNLVSNAVRYTRSGRVLIGARRRGAAVELQVWDTGPGIAPEHVPHLFEVYRRFDDTSSGAEQGVGLGLALVKKQADLLGHVLDLHSTPGQGTRFGILLPRAPA